MKLITAIIREVQLDQVREALIKNGITRITVSQVSGHGQQHQEELYRGRKVTPDLIPKMRLDIAINDEYLDLTTSTIIKAAKTGEFEDIGEVGDGKIFITNLEECIRIRTQERGPKAI